MLRSSELRWWQARSGFHGRGRTTTGRARTGRTGSCRQEQGIQSAEMAKKDGSFAGWLQRVRKTGEHSDVTVKIQGEEFKLHMLPLVNESTYFRNLSTNRSSSSSSSSSQSVSAPSPSSRRTNRVVLLDDLPGGAEAFSIAADFCYIIRSCYSFRNVGPVRAAAEFLGMHDLVESTKKFLYSNVFISWKSCIALLREYHRVYPPTDDYIESRSLRVISAACIKAFRETKHVSVPILLSMITGGAGSSSSISSPSQNLKETLLAVPLLPDPYSGQLQDMLVNSDTNLNIKCRQSRNVREWLDYLIRIECKRLKSKVWIVLCLSRMLLRNSPKNKPFLELSSQYWCSLLEHAGNLIEQIGDDESQSQDADQAISLRSVKEALEQKIGASLDELDDYIQAYSFDPDTLLALVKHFMAEKSDDELELSDQQAEIQAIAREIDGCLWGYAESGAISIDTFVALEEAFPAESRSCHDMLYAAVEKLLEKNKLGSSDDVQRVWRSVDCSKLTLGVYEKAMSNPSYLSQPHVLECVLRRHSDELANEPSTSSSSSSSRQQDLKDIMQKVIKASLKLLEENSKRSKEIKELQKQYANLVSTSGFKVYPSADSVENSPMHPPNSREEILKVTMDQNHHKPL